MVKMNAPSASWTAPQVTPELYEGIAQGTPRTCASLLCHNRPLQVCFSCYSVVTAPRDLRLFLAVRSI